MPGAGTDPVRVAGVLRHGREQTVDRLDRASVERLRGDACDVPILVDLEFLDRENGSERLPHERCARLAARLFDFEAHVAHARTLAIRWGMFAA